MPLTLLSECIRTKSEHSLFTENLRLLRAKLAGSPEKVTAKELFDVFFDADTADIMLELSQTEGGGQLDSFLTRVEAEVNCWPQVRVTIALRPTERLIRRVHNWFMNEMGHVVIVAFDYEPSLLAGAIVEWDGRYRDYSLSCKMNNYFDRSDIAKILKIFFMISYQEALNNTNEIGTVEELYGGSVVTASGLPQASPGEVVIFEEGQLGRVFSLQDEVVEILILTQAVPVQSGERVARAGTPFRLPVGEAYLGKSINPLGTQWKTHTDVRGLSEERGVDEKPPPLTQRMPVTTPFISGVSMVDLVVPLGTGQRELIIGDHKVGKTQLLLQSMRTHIQRGGVGYTAG
jgi:hypothetical protein